MTIQEAIKSGKRCRRKSDSFGPNFGKLRQDNSNDRIVFEYTSSALLGSLGIMPITIEDILADDWEIEREPRDVWLVEHQSGEFYSAVFKSELTAKASTAASNAFANVIKFREVIE